VAVIDGGDTFDRVLVNSEARLAVLRRAQTRLRTARRAQAGVAALALAAVAVALLGADNPGDGEGAWVTLSFSVAAVGLAADLAIQATLVLPLGRRAATEERAILSEINRLRELFIHIARREEWDHERIRATRQRLSQFPIEGGTLR
jgi:hypothetical protein